jgi:hypothetical protein
MTIQNLGTKTEVLNFLPNDVVTATVTASTAIDLVGLRRRHRRCALGRFVQIALQKT